MSRNIEGIFWIKAGKNRKLEEYTYCNECNVMWSNKLVTHIHKIIYPFHDTSKRIYNLSL